MDGDIFDLLAREQGPVFLCLAAGFAVVVGAFVMRRLGDVRADNPKVILRRIRWEIRSARDEFSKYPATRQIQEIVEGLGDCEETIDRVVARL